MQMCLILCKNDVSELEREKHIAAFDKYLPHLHKRGRAVGSELITFSHVEHILGKVVL